MPLGVLETAMGVSLHGRDKKFQNEYRQAVYAMGDILVHRLIDISCDFSCAWIIMNFY